MARAQAQLGHEVSIYTTKSGRARHAGRVHGPPGEVGRRGLRYYPVPAPEKMGCFSSSGAGPEKMIPWWMLYTSIPFICSIRLFPRTIAINMVIPYVLRPHVSLDPNIYKRHRFRKRSRKSSSRTGSPARIRDPFHHGGRERTCRAVHPWNPRVVGPDRAERRGIRLSPLRGTLFSRFPS